jgi:molybdopterin converting factor small subunit
MRSCGYSFNPHEVKLIFGAACKRKEIMRVMKVKLKLFATFREYLPEGNDGHSSMLELIEGTKVQSILEQMKLPKDTPKIILINGIQKTADETLKEGDTLSVFPPIAGG